MNQAARKQAETTTILNGVDVTALGQAVAGLVADPSQGQVTFRACTAWQSGTRSRSAITSFDVAGRELPRSHEIFADEPVELLGGNTAPNPQELLLAALGACMTVGFVAGATGQGIELEELEIRTECSLDLRGVFGLDPQVPPGARKIKYTVRVRGNGTREQFEQIHRDVTMTSPNYYHLANPIAFESELVVG